MPVVVVWSGMPTERAMSRIVLGCSTLGLPTLGDDDYTDYAMETLFTKAPYRQIEIHLDERLQVRPGQRLFTPEVVARFRRIASAARAQGASVLLGFGGRHLLSDRKHRPTLFEEDAAAADLRVRMLREGVLCAAEVGARGVIFLTGPSHLALDETKYRTPEWQRLLRSFESLVVAADALGVTLAPEAHGQHLFSRIADLMELKRHFDTPALGFTADTVHQAIVERGKSLEETYREAAPHITHVQVDYAVRLPRSWDAPIEKTSLFDAPIGRQRLGDILVRERIVRPEQLDGVLEEDPADEASFATRLVALGICAVEDIERARAQQRGVGVVDVDGAYRGLVAGGYEGALAVESFVRDVPEVDALEYARAVGRYMAARYRLPARSPLALDALR